MSDFAELDAILNRYLDGVASAEEIARLENALAEDQQFADHFARWCLAHRQITELLNESKLHQLMDDFVTSAPTLPKAARRRGLHLPIWPRAINDAQLGDRRQAGARARFTMAHLSAIVTLAAMITVVATLLATDWWGTRSSTVDASLTDSPAQLMAKDGEAEFVATLTQAMNASWAPGAEVYEHGQQLRAGSRIALSSGVAKVTYDCGAEIALQGPCEFVVRERMVGVIESGRLTANVPRRAFSFAILSPQADFVDLGTAFGIDVGDDGRTELHVFEGEVLYSQPQSPGTQGNGVFHVTANEAVEFSSAEDVPSRISLREDQFSDLFALRRAADIEVGHVAESKLALWLAADVAVTTDSEERVVSWQDIVYGDNTAGEDAIQMDGNARPLLVKDAIGSRPAIRFDGDSDYLLTTPLETTDDQTVLLVCQFSQSAFKKGRRWGGQIINYDGPPSRYLSDTLEPGVLQIGEPLLEKEFRPTLISAQVFAGFIGSAVVESGRMDTMQTGADRPIIVAYVYDYDYQHGKSRMFVNGKSYGEARAFAPQGITSRKIIGRHAWMQNYFHGDLAELMIYNKALSEGELLETMGYLAEKYGIAMEQPGPAVD